MTTLLATPAARGLFSAVIAQSSAAASVFDPVLTAQWAGRFAGLLGADPNDVDAVAARLAVASPQELVTATDRLKAELTDVAPGTLALCPVVDGDILPRDPIEAVVDGAAAPVPLLIGTNATEGRLFSKIKALDLLPTSVDRIETMFAATDPSARDRVVAGYPGYPAPRACADLAGDLVFTHPATRLADGHSRHAPVWLYRLDASTRLLDLLGLGATHGMEVGLVFGDTGSMTERLLGAFGGRAARRQVAARMQQHWTTFARTGAPLDSWPRYEVGTRQVLEFGSEDQVVADPYARVRAAWQDYRAWGPMGPQGESPTVSAVESPTAADHDELAG